MEDGDKWLQPYHEIIVIVFFFISAVSSLTIY